MQKWPVIVSLHGGGRQGSDGLRPTEIGWAARIRADRTRYPVAVFPQAAVGSSWIDREMADHGGAPERAINETLLSWLLSQRRGASGTAPIPH